MNADPASFVFGLNPLIGLVSVIVGGYSGDKLGWKKSLTLIISTAMISLFLTLLSVSAIQAVLFYLIYGFFNIMTMPITTLMVGRIVPRESRGTAYSLQFIPGTIAGVLMSIALAMLIESYGYGSSSLLQWFCTSLSSRLFRFCDSIDRGLGDSGF